MNNQSIGIPDLLDAIRLLAIEVRSLQSKIDKTCDVIEKSAKEKKRKPIRNQIVKKKKWWKI